MNIGSFHTKSFRRKHILIFRYRWAKNGSTGPSGRDEKNSHWFPERRDEKKNSHWFPERLCNMVQLAGPSVINFDKLLFEFITQNKQFKVNKTSFLRHI